MIRVLTLNWNGADKLAKLYPTLRANLEGIEWKWYLRDNGSIDNSLETVQGWEDPHVMALPHPNNLQNFSQGMNYCFQQANPQDDDLVLLLNNDIVFNDTTSLRSMIALMKNDVGVVGARLLYPGTNKLQHCGVVFDPTYRTPMHFRAGQESDAAAERNRLFQAVTGAVMLLRAGDYRKAFKNKTGEEGLDHNYSWAFDDVDLCLAVHYNLGKKIVYCGKTNISHEESASLKKNPVNRLFLNQNILYLWKKWGGRYQLDRPTYEADPNYNEMKDE